MLIVRVGHIVDVRPTYLGWLLKHIWRVFDSAKKAKGTGRVG